MSTETFSCLDTLVKSNQINSKQFKTGLKRVVVKSNGFNLHCTSLKKQEGFDRTIQAPFNTIVTCNNKTHWMTGRDDSCTIYHLGKD